MDEYDRFRSELSPVVHKMYAEHLLRPLESDCFGVAEVPDAVPAEIFTLPRLRSIFTLVLRELDRTEEMAAALAQKLRLFLRACWKLLRPVPCAYETARTRSAYIAMPTDTPGGVIMYNDASVTNTSTTRSWGINSALTSSLAGWSQRASFQSSGTEGEYHYSSASLYELYTQKELQGSLVRLVFFNPDSDTGNVQTAGFGYDTVAGAMWGTSDALLVNTDSVSAWPVYVTGRNQSIAEVWRDGRLVHTQQLQAGVQALDTRP